MVKAHFKDSVCLSSRGKKRERGQWGSSGNPPSITGEPIIKDKLQYTSLGYANSKLDVTHQKISIAMFCIYKLKMSAFRTYIIYIYTHTHIDKINSFNTYRMTKEIKKT